MRIDSATCGAPTAGGRHDREPLRTRTVYASPCGAGKTKRRPVVAVLGAEARYVRARLQLSRPIEQLVAVETLREERSGVALTRAGIVVYVHDGVPTDAGFDHYLDFCRRHREAIRGYLVLAPSGLPTPAQRARSTADYDAFDPVRSAVLTDLAEARSITRSLDAMRGGDWFRAFSPAALAEARAYLELTSEDFADALGAIRHLSFLAGVRVPAPLRDF